MEDLILEKQRRECWLQAWASVAGSPFCKETKAATRWADEALKAFDERFKKEVPNV